MSTARKRTLFTRPNKDRHAVWDGWAVRKESPGDIVTARNGEESRDIRVNAADLRATTTPRITSHSPLTLRALQAICEKRGARLMIVALPIDVQVSSKEWLKYGVAPVDIEPTRILNEDIVTAAHAAGADGFDATPSLVAAEPGAFLDGDIHLTPKGHQAVGEALAKALRAPKVSVPGPGLPPFRSPPPRADEWLPNTEIAVRESDPAGCETKKVREWIGIFCRHKGGAKGVVVTSGSEVLAGALPGGAMLVAPVVPHQDLRATFAFDSGNRDFVVKAGDTAETAEIGFTKAGPAVALGAAAGPAPETNAFCTCFTKLTPGNACAAGDPAAQPRCQEGRANAGAAGRCRALCGPDVPCQQGRCTDWQGGRACM